MKHVIPLLFACLFLSSSAFADIDIFGHAIPAGGSIFDQENIKSALRGNAESLATLRKAAGTGDANAEYAMGYVLSMGPYKDCPASVEWFRKAAEQGHAMAQGELSGMYYWGTCKGRTSADYNGYPPQADNPAEAYYWRLLYEKTIEEYPDLAGHPPHSDLVISPDDTERQTAITNARYEKGLTTAQVDDIKRRVADWSPQGVKDKNTEIKRLLSYIGALGLALLIGATYRTRRRLK